MDKSQRLDVYLSLLQDEFSPELRNIEENAINNGVPIIRRQAQYYMRMMCQLVRPEKILEIGTAVGFSGLLMLESDPVEATLDTIESFPPRIKEAKSNFSMSLYSDKIHLFEGDAMEILPTLSGKYDLIFMDASKGQYVRMLPIIKGLMHSGSVLITDNILQEGNLIESSFSIKRRDRTIHKRIREFLETITSDPELVTDTLSLGDGMTIAVRK
jgi:predicted O-methyltransferase YrrM